jgi:hypothetical protein
MNIYGYKNKIKTLKIKLGGEKRKYKKEKIKKMIKKYERLLKMERIKQNKK